MHVDGFRLDAVSYLVEDGMLVEVDHVYLIPPKKEMIISGGRLLRKSGRH